MAQPERTAVDRDEVVHANGAAHTGGAAHGNGAAHTNGAAHGNGVAHTNGAAHADDTAHATGAAHGTGDVVRAIDIATAAGLVWAALTDGDLTQRYWQRRIVADWRRGGGWRHERRDGTADFIGTVLEVEPPRRLVHTWARPAEAGDAARTSVVSIDITPAGRRVRVTVTHRNLPADEAAGTARAWARMLAALKDLLETGPPKV